MPCPHNEITIVQRSQRQSAVAAAAYQSGEKLFCEYDQQVKHYPEKRGIVHNEILLPPNAPQEYADRNTLWNAAEAVEKQWNSQLARRWVLTIPREIPPDQYAVLVREFCEQQFVSKGMIADFAIHDPHPPGHNPHAHVLLTMRAMDEHGKWLPKSRKVYDLDKNGERIKLPSGRWKSHKEDTVDWNDQKYCEIWRHEWEVIQNRYLEANDRPERVDLRSYARQGLDIVPTVHEGAAVRQMEKRGIQTNIGNLNREIRAANSLMKSIRQLIQNLKGWITELGEKRKELLAQKAAEEATLLPNLLMKYTNVNLNSRVVCFVLKGMGENLRKIAMHITNDFVTSAVGTNFKNGVATWCYFDEFHILLRDPLTASYFVTVWKMLRKQGCVPSALTQNVKDLLASREIENILDNTDFMVLLSQAQSDRAILAKQIGISEHQLSYIT